MKSNFLYVAIAFFLFSCKSHTVKKVDGDDVKTGSVTAGIGIVDLSSVKSINTLLCQDWVYKDDADAIDNSDGTSDMEIPFRSFSFFPDSTMVKDARGEMHFGKWQLNSADKNISIKYDNGKKDSYKIRAIGAKDMILIKSGENEPLAFIADGKQEQNYTDNPFYIANNQWRIKPKQAENDAAIKQRLKQCINFYILYFNDNVKRDAATISFYGLPSCFNWYTGGIGLQSESKLKPIWLNIFYDRDEEVKAHDMVEELLSKKYDWDTTQTNWIKQSTPVLKQMYDSLK